MALTAGAEGRAHQDMHRGSQDRQIIVTQVGRLRRQGELFVAVPQEAAVRHEEATVVVWAVRVIVDVVAHVVVPPVQRCPVDGVALAVEGVCEAHDILQCARRHVALMGGEEMSDE